MRTKSAILIVIALGCGLVATIGISQVINSRPQAEVEETVRIYVALNNVDVNEQLSQEVVKLEDWPKAKVPENAVTNFEDLDSKFVMTRLYAGEPILKPKLAEKPQTHAITIPPNHRVFTLKVRMESAVAGLLRPGDRVDIIGFFKSGRDVPTTTTRAVLRNVRVFAVNQETRQEVDDEGRTIVAKTVSVLVKREQVEPLMLASELGTLRLSLRRPDEEYTENESRPATAQELFGNGDENADEGNVAGNAEAGNPSGLQGRSILDLLTAARTPAIAPQPTVPVAVTEARREPVWRMAIVGPDGAQKFVWHDEKDLPQPEQPLAAPLAPPAAAGNTSEANYPESAEAEAPEQPEKPSDPNSDSDRPVN